jgi:hypothetical protein
MAFISGIATMSENDLYSSTASPAAGFYPGQIVWDGKAGKAFRYTLNGNVTGVIGNLLQAAAQDTTYENMAVGTAGAVGDTFIQVTNGTATITAAQFVGGSISVYTAGTVAIGDEYTILGFSADSVLTTGGALKVLIDRPLRYAYTTSAKVNMKRSPWSGVLQMPQTTQTEMPVGVHIAPAVANQYCFVQTHGVCAALSDNSTFAVGSMLSPSLAVAGAVGVNVAGTTHGTIGWARQAAASAHAISIFLQID